MMFSQVLIAFPFLSTVVLGAPQGAPGNPPGTVGNCKAAPILIAIAAPPFRERASAFCSDFIRSTTTVTSVETAVTIATEITQLPDVQTTTETTTTEFTTIFTTITNFLPDTTTTTISTETIGLTTAVAGSPRKRALPPIPGPLKVFASSAISSACSCIVTPPASTVVVPQTTTVISTTTETAAPTYTSVSTIVSVVVVTDQATEQKTLPATRTDIATSLTTITVPVVTIAPRCRVTTPNTGIYQKYQISLSLIPSNTPSLCKSKCLDETTCKSYSIFDNSGPNGYIVCTLHNAPVVYYQAGTAPFTSKAYDLACVV